MNRLLQALGLMRVSEHERIVEENDNRAYDSWIKMINERDFYVDEYKALEAKFKKAITDLAAAREEVAMGVAANEKMRFDKGRLAAANSSLQSEIADLRPDALAMRRKRERDRNRKAEKKEAGN